LCGYRFFLGDSGEMRAPEMVLRVTIGGSVVILYWREERLHGHE